MTDLRKNASLRVLARILTIVVGCIILFAAVLKALDPRAFADQIAQYRILPSLSFLAAWCFIIAETVIAVGLIAQARVKIFAPLGIALLAAFIGITAYGMVSGVTGSCGCFGNLVHRSPEQVIVEDALMIIALLFALLVLRSEPARRMRLKIGVVTAAALGMAALTAFGGSLPVDSFVTGLKPGAEFEEWPVEGFTGNLHSGTHVVFLFSLSDPAVETDISIMNTIAQAPEVPSACGFITDGSEELTRLLFQYAPAFNTGAIEPRFARALYRTLPRTFIIKDGVVTHVWQGIPLPAQVTDALTRGG